MISVLRASCGSKLRGPTQFVDWLATRVHLSIIIMSTLLGRREVLNSEGHGGHERPHRVNKKRARMERGGGGGV